MAFHTNEAAKTQSLGYKSEDVVVECKVIVPLSEKN
jgi:hypothetical protein